MAKNDYFIIVYQILTYLYHSLKEGLRIDERLIKYDSPYIRINEKYWSYIMWHMQQEKLIEGAVFVDNSLGDVPYPLEIDKCRITPTGIEYLCENSLMSKAKRFLQDVKDIIPFVLRTL